MLFNALRYWWAEQLVRLHLAVAWVLAVATSARVWWGERMLSLRVDALWVAVVVRAAGAAALSRLRAFRARLTIEWRAYLTFLQLALDETPVGQFVLQLVHVKLKGLFAGFWTNFFRVSWWRSFWQRFKLLVVNRAATMGVQGTFVPPVVVELPVPASWEGTVRVCGRRRSSWLVRQRCSTRRRSVPCTRPGTTRKRWAGSSWGAWEFS